MPCRRIIGLTLATLTIGLCSLLAIGRAQAGGGGCHEPTTDARGTEIDLKGNCMITTVLHVQTGDTVTFTNRDEVQHTVTGANGSWGSAEQLGSQQSVTQTFTEKGVYPYFCYLHPGMVGAIVVGDGSGSGLSTGAGARPAGDVLTSSVAAAGGRSASPATTGTDTGVKIALALVASAAMMSLAGVIAYTRTSRARKSAGAAS